MKRYKYEIFHAVNGGFFTGHIHTVYSNSNDANLWCEAFERQGYTGLYMIRREV